MPTKPPTIALDRRTARTALALLGVVLWLPAVAMADEPPAEQAVSRGDALEVAAARPESAPPSGRSALVRTRMSVRAEIESRSPVAWLERFGPVETRALQDAR